MISSNTHHRSDIDGLRAIGVLAVIFFHVKINLFKGGFVGVDIFFVISGYLITHSIISDVSNGNFKLFDFYEKRARRIFPALSVMLIACAISSYFLMPSIDYLNFSKSLFASIFSFSNIVFWKETGYFDSPAEVKPLLHTWSLGIEGQFYIIFPILILFLFKLKKEKAISVLTIIFLFSIILSQWSAMYHSAVAFYLLPSRVWELIMGALLAFKVFPAVENRKLNLFLSVLGTCLIFFSFVSFSANIAFPGLHALFPTIGTALIIYSNEKELNLIGNIYSIRPLRFIGAISYSLYLWHWPLLVFYKYVSFSNLSFINTLIILFFSLIISIVSWKYVEAPFLKRNSMVPRKLFLYFSGSIALSLTIVSLSGYLTDGSPNRLSPTVAKYEKAAFENFEFSKYVFREMTPNRAKDRDFSVLGDISSLGYKFILWGDSHAHSLAPVFDKLAKEHGVKGWLAAYPACPPLLDIVRVDKRLRHIKCKEFNTEIISLIKENEIDHVILAAYWSIFTNDEPTIAFSKDAFSKENIDECVVFKESFVNTLKKISDTKAKVWVAEQVPCQKVRVPIALAQYVMYGYDINQIGIQKDEHIKKLKKVNNVLNESAGKFKRINTEKLFFPKDKCVVYNDGKSLYRDNHHLSEYGSVWLSDMFRPIFKQITNENNKKWNYSMGR